MVGSHEDGQESRLDDPGVDLTANKPSRSLEAIMIKKTTRRKGNTYDRSRGATAGAGEAEAEAKASEGENRKFSRAWRLKK